MTNLIAFICLVVLITLGTFFVQEGKMGSTFYIGYVLGLILLFLAFYSFDRLKELDLAKMRLVLKEYKDTKDELDKEVVLLLDILAKSNIDSAINTGRWVEDDIAYKMIEKRDYATELFQQAGHDEEYIKRQTDIINSYLLGDIVSELIKESKGEVSNKDINPEEKREIINSLNKFPQEVRKSTIPNEQLVDTIKQRLSDYGLSVENYEEYFKDISYFINNKHLRRPLRD